MPSLDERREVAARLRSVTDEEYRMCFLEEILTGCVGAAYVYDSECQLDVRLMVNRLANLIEPEPEPERTCRMEHNERKRGVYCSHCGKRMDSFVCNNYGDGTMEYAYPFCCKCGAKVVE